MSTNENQGEIDIIVLFKKIQATFVHIIIFFFKWAKYLVRQWKAFLFLILFGAILGFFNESQNNSDKEASVLLKVNFDAVNYVYDAVSLINQKIEANDIRFFNEMGFSSEEINVFELTISPIVNLQEIINDDTFKANEIKTLFENLTFDDNLSMTNSFISNYIYHTLTCSFSPAADSQTIDIIIEYLNTNPLFTELKLRKMNSFSDRIESNEKAINQIDAIILKYTNEISNSSNTDSQLYVDNKDIRPNDLIKTKIELSKEIEILKEEKIYSNNTVVVVNNSNLMIETSSIKNNKIIYYPLLLCFIFIIIQVLKKTYSWLDNLESKQL